MEIFKFFSRNFGTPTDWCGPTLTRIAKSQFLTTTTIIHFDAEVIDPLNK